MLVWSSQVGLPFLHRAIGSVAAGPIDPDVPAGAGYLILGEDLEPPAGSLVVDFPQEQRSLSSPMDC